MNVAKIQIKSENTSDNSEKKLMTYDSYDR